MQSGILDHETFNQLLRGISQKRRHGVLEIASGERVVRVLFSQGKVVEVTEDDLSPVGEVQKILKAAGLVSQDVNAGTYKDLAQAVQNEVPDELLKRVIKHRVLDRFYNIDLASGAYYKFDVRMVQIEKDFLPSVSSGSLLLDMVAYESDSTRFNELFPADSEIFPNDEKSSSLSEEEEIIWDLISDGARIAEIQRRSMLSRFHVQEALLTLYERGIIGARKALARDDAVSKQEGLAGEQKVAPTAKKKSKATSASEAAGEKKETAAVSQIDDIFSSLEGSLDAVFEEELGTSSETHAPEPEVDLEPVEIDDEEFEDVVSDAMAQAQLSYLNARLLHQSWVPHSLVAAIVIASILAPFLFWPDAIFGLF